MSKFTALPETAAKLKAMTGRDVKYRAVYNAVLDGFPAVRLNGRWNICNEDLPALAAALKLHVIPAEQPSCAA